MFVWSLITRQHKSQIYTVGLRDTGDTSCTQSFLIGLEVKRLCSFAGTAHFHNFRQIGGKFHSPPVPLFVTFPYLHLPLMTQKGLKREFTQALGSYEEQKRGFLRRNRCSTVFCFYLVRFLYNQSARLEVTACCFCDKLVCHGESSQSWDERRSKCLLIQVPKFL